MSSESIIALAAVLTSGVLGVASLAFSFWSSSSERRQRLSERREDNREWRRRTLFEKRLQVVQQAYAWWRRLNEAVGRASMSRDPDNADRDAARELAVQASEWYYNNSFCLDGPGLSEMRPGLSKFVGLTNSALAWASGRDVDIHASLNEVYKSLLELASGLLESEHGEQVEASHGG
jgi:hypothetical protein